ncbi:hypothetical protein OPW32_08805 [Vibrio europaeus]|uniref:hypothetical protein n=1 Tax=Vibrio europaeus TaxID=300876 RepID=UPI0023425D40|nr:hypothetical protein [Vibrio europaeus]MDC5849302.1 hypothetical protein [Vibrio europaeus]
MRRSYQLSATTQGPLYPPAEVMDAEGNFVVVGQIPSDSGVSWSGAIVAPETPVPEFGEIKPYRIVTQIEQLSEQQMKDITLFTLPLPLPSNNYPMIFAPEQRPQASSEVRSSFPLHQGYIEDYRYEDGKRHIPPINLFDWLKAKGELVVSLKNDKQLARFDFQFSNLVPNSLYTVMSLREKDLCPESPSRPGPLGIPNVFVTDALGSAQFWAELPDPFPAHELEGNRVINVVVLYMSSRQSYGGAIGLHGLGGDIHAQLKLKQRSFDEFVTTNNRED